MKEHKDLDLEEDTEGHRRGHKYKVAGFCTFTLLLVSVLLGSTGNGIISWDRQVAATGEVVEAEKFTRYESPMEIRIHTNTTLMAEGDSLFDVSFPVSYFENYTIESILPEPEATEISDNRIVFSFRVRSPSKDQLITYHLRSSKAFKTAKADILLESQGMFSISQFIYP